MASAVDSRLAYARLPAVATASRLPTATRGSNNSYTTSWDTTDLSYSDGSIIESYASPCYGGGEAGPVIGAGGEANEVEPAQVVVEIACGDATARTQEVLQPAVAAVHRLHMQIAPNPFPHRAVECFVAHPERGGARGGGT